MAQVNRSPFEHRNQEGADHADEVPDRGGGGAEVAVAADIRIAADDIRIGFNQVSLAIMPAWGGAERLGALVGRSRALLLAGTGQVLDAAAAFRMGLVDQVARRIRRELAHDGSTVGASTSRRDQADPGRRSGDRSRQRIRPTVGVRRTLDGCRRRDEQGQIGSLPARPSRQKVRFHPAPLSYAGKFYSCTLACTRSQKSPRNCFTLLHAPDHFIYTYPPVAANMRTGCAYASDPLSGILEAYAQVPRRPCASATVSKIGLMKVRESR